MSIPPKSIADLAETTGRHYRSPHLLRPANRRRAALAWAAAAVLVTAAALMVLLLLQS